MKLIKTWRGYVLIKRPAMDGSKYNWNLQWCPKLPAKSGYYLVAEAEGGGLKYFLNQDPYNIFFIKNHENIFRSSSVRIPENSLEKRMKIKRHQSDANTIIVWNVKKYGY